MGPSFWSPRFLVTLLLLGSACGSGGPASKHAGGQGGQSGAGGGEVSRDAAGGSGGAPRPAPDAAPDVTAATADGPTDPPPALADAATPDTGSGGAADTAGAVDPPGAVTWAIDNLQRIGGHTTVVLGAPVVIDTPAGKALQFDGNDDALFVENHPLAGLAQFTVEIFFRPDAGGSPAQRWFHMQEGSAGGRVLFETRLPGNDRWVLDVFVESRAGEVALYTPSRTHPLGQWYHVAAVVDGKRARHYVNGEMESDVALGFQTHGPGRTSIGVRITRNYFFKGAIRVARFTPRVLTPAEFLK